MSNIDDKISDYKQIIADLEKQKKDEEEAYKNTIDYNMEQLDKYVENIETKIQQRREVLKTEYSKGDIMPNQHEDIISNIILQYKCNQYKTLIYEYKNDENIKLQNLNGLWSSSQLRKYQHHIFEFIYKILKHLFTSNKKLSNDYDNVISRLNKLEEENRQLKTCQINYYDIKERLNIIEIGNKQLKETLASYNDVVSVEKYEIDKKIYTIESRLDTLEYNTFDDFEERLDILENENKYLKEKLYDLI